MRLGGHFRFGQDIDQRGWEAAVRSFYEKVRRTERCVFVCHNRRETLDARRIDPRAELFLAPSYVDYLRFYARAKCGIMNRVHGAFAIASFGRPAFVVGTDSRARMAEEIGLRHAFVNDVRADRLMDEYSRMRTEENIFARQLERARSVALDGYLGVLETLVSPASQGGKRA
jgi:hypothetical protein